MIRAIYISAERNGAIESPREARVVEGKGIEGDQFNSAHPDPIEYWQPRRNILTQGISLNELVGLRFEIGGAQFEGVQTCEPCELMRSRTSPTAFKWFLGKGGLRAKVLRSGTLRIGDTIVIH